MSNQVPLPLPAALAGSDGPLFVGRAAELAEFERIWASVSEASRQVVFIGGEPGVGKTRLVREVAVTLHEHGAAVLWGACHADLDLAYRPFVAAFDELLGAAEPGALTPVLGSSATQLTRLTTKVARHRPDLEGTEPPGDGARLALFDAVRDLLVALAARQPVVVVLEDLHWASSPTLQLLAHLVQSTARAQLLVLVTHRSTVPDRRVELTHTIADLYRHDGVTRLDLDGLDIDEVADYLARGSGMAVEAARTSAAALREQTAGNPFFLQELWRELSTRGGVAALDHPDFTAPPSVRDALERRLADLDDVTADVFELAAVAGERFDIAVLLDASEHAREVTFDAVDLGIDFGLFVATGDHPAGHRFVHALARQAVLDRTAASRRLRKHAALAEALERGGTGDPAVVAQLAHHYERAQLLGYAEKAVTYLVAAAGLAERSLAHGQAAGLLARAAELVGGDAPRRWQLLLAAARAWMRAGDFRQARALYEQLAGVDDQEIRLHAAIGYEDASWRPGLLGDRSVELLTVALADPSADAGDDPVRIRALASLGRALSFTGDGRRAEELGERALACARRSGDDDLLAHAIVATLWLGMTPRLAPTLLERATELSELARRLGDQDHLGTAAFLRSLFGYVQGVPSAWEEARDDLVGTVHSSGQPFFRYMAGCETYGRQFATGDLAGAGRTVATLGELGAEFGEDAAEGSHGMQVFMVKRATGALEAVRPMMSGDEDPDEHWAPGLLALYVELGWWEAAARVLTHLMDRLELYRAVSAMWAGVLAFLVDAAVRLGDEATAATLRPDLAAYQGRNLVAGQFVAVFGSADRELARIDSLLGSDSAETHFEVALAMDRRMGARTHEVETLVAWSRHVTASEGVRAERAGRLATEARALAERIGHRRALKDLGASGTPVAVDVLDERPDGLTEREVDVLRLVGEGLANREIGERLFISQNTAANHVRSILMKTGAANRTRAAIYAAEHQLLADRPPLPGRPGRG